MKLTKRSIINGLILFFAFSMFFMGVKHAIEIFDGFDKLQSHKGVVENVSLVTEYSDEDSSLYAKLKFYNKEEEYSVFRFPEKVKNLVRTGDSVEVYTKPITSRFGNLSTNGKGGGKVTLNPNEVYHLVSNQYDTPIIDFEDHRTDLKRSVWLWPLFSLAAIGWYFYRRSGKKSPFIMEYGV